jgi:hypothetical protein
MCSDGNGTQLPASRGARPGRSAPPGNSNAMPKPAPPVPGAPRPLTPAEEAEVKEFGQRVRKRPLAPRIRVVGEREVAPADGANPALFAARVTGAVGNPDPEAINLLIGQVAGSLAGGDLATVFNGVLAELAGIQPRNEVEGMLAVQMVAAHNLGLEMVRRATKTERLDCLATYGSLATKLLRTFTAQTEVLARLRGQTGQQTVRVEHVTVESGGQAVVGAVSTGGVATAAADGKKS